MRDPPWESLAHRGESYQLGELKGTPLKRRAVASHIKRFYARGTTSFDETAGSDSEGEEVSDNSSKGLISVADQESLADQESISDHSNHQPDLRRSRRLNSAEDSSQDRGEED